MGASTINKRRSTITRVLAFLLNFESHFQQWASSLGHPLEALLRLMLAAIFGGLIGLEREVRGRQAGFRTNLLVCVGSALVMLVSISFPERRWNHDPDINLNIDPARIAYRILTGIGFLGARTILQHRAAGPRPATAA